MVTTATISDSHAISQLVNSAYRGEGSKQGWTTEADLLDGTRTDENAISDLLGRDDTRILKYEENGTLLGCVELRKTGHQLYLGMLTVKPHLQGKGIGKILLQAAEKEAVALKCSSIIMNVISRRTELIAWYLRHGYADNGKRKPFQVPDVRWGIPKVSLEFMELEKHV